MAAWLFRPGSSTTRGGGVADVGIISLLVEETTRIMPGLKWALISSMLRQTQALPVALVLSVSSRPTPTPEARQLPTMWILTM